ncbi:hypothetical protein Vadar_014020 [Vaccinium darrowii]|uniref:Uncharacterized protein n=1 Tax=Vaccinium darrowii TaxID=229202 RepID=A0ACB7XYY6_9ERIC|nr:hypothetical protein Vadar_014020 [Vaccinium darrowii]
MQIKFGAEDDGSPSIPAFGDGLPSIPAFGDGLPSIPAFGAVDDGSPSIPASSGGNTVYTYQPMQVALLGNSQNLQQSNISRYTPDFTEFTIEREIENLRSREEMVKLEAFHQQKLEEVMRRKMMERELFMRRLGAGGLGLSLVDPLLQTGGVGTSGLGLSSVDPLQQPDVPGVPFQSRRDGVGNGLEGGIDRRLSLAAPVGNQCFREFPFQRLPRSEMENGGSVKIKPIIDLSKGRIKPSNSSVAGIKRKFEEPIPQAVEEDTPLVNLRKKAQKEFRCALCQVTVSSEMDMEAHLNGRKHTNLVNTTEKAQEELKCAVCQVTVGSEKDLEAHLNGRKHTNLVNATEKAQEELKCAVCQVTVGSEKDMEAHLNGRKHKDLVSLRTKWQEELKSDLCLVTVSCKKTTEAHDMNERPKESNTDFKFYCRMCDFGTMSKQLMADHRMEDMHWTLLQQNGGCVITIKTTPDDIEYAGETE